MAAQRQQSVGLMKDDLEEFRNELMVLFEQIKEIFIEYTKEVKNLRLEVKNLSDKHDVTGIKSTHKEEELKAGKTFMIRYIEHKKGSTVFGDDLNKKFKEFASELPFYKKGYKVALLMKELGLKYSKVKSRYVYSDVILKD